MDSLLALGRPAPRGAARTDRRDAPIFGHQAQRRLARSVVATIGVQRIDLLLELLDIVERLVHAHESDESDVVEGSQPIHGHLADVARGHFIDAAGAQRGLDLVGGLISGVTADGATGQRAGQAVGELVPALRRFGRVTWATEYGRNTSRDSRHPGDDGRNGIKTELRDIKVGPMRFLGSYEDIGEIFYTDELSSGDNRNKNGYTRYYAEAHYRVPTKAVNLKGWTYKEEPKAGPDAEEGTRKEWGTEAYLEFVNGFTGKVEYKVHENRDGTWPNLFTEITGENRLVKLMLQYRIKDIDADYEITAYGFGVNVNLTEDWKFYARVMNVDELTESRQTAFAQLRYLGWSGAEFFVEYGNPDHSNDFVNDGDFVTNGDWAPRSPQEVFKAFVRIYY